jgi:hypothetical protein
LSTYYYAAAALPMLFFPDKPSISSEEFISFCREQLTEADFTVLEASRLGGTAEEASLSAARGGMILKKWYAWETALRNELVKQRASRLKKDPADYTAPGEEIIGMEETAKNAMSGEDPLETEKKLYEARWRYLEELGTNIFFTLDSLIVYYLQLQLLEKLNKFDRERGEENFNAVYRQIREIESNSGVNP